VLNASTIVACPGRVRLVTVGALARVWLPPSALAADAGPDFGGKLPAQIAAWEKPAKPALYD
jgi:hypothetical protein